MKTTKRSTHQCSLCGNDIGTGKLSLSASITDHVCQACLDKPDFELSIPAFRDLLNRNAFPVVAVDGECRIRAANHNFCKLVGKEDTMIEGELVGPVMKCAYSKITRGCGCTIHCTACTIRSAVTDTHATGKPHICLHAYQDIQTNGIEKKLHFLISTEKLCSFVLLSITLQNT